MPATGPTAPAKPRQRQAFRRPPTIQELDSKRRTPTPHGSRAGTPAPQASKCCDKPDHKEDNGQLVCQYCGTVISDFVIVNDVTFGEAPSGAALVQGTTVHEGQRYAKLGGTSFRRGRSSEEVKESVLRTGKDELTRLANSLFITNLIDKAHHIFQLSRVHHFHLPISESAAICLYIASRQVRGSTILLIDFAERIRRNVFDLGASYKRFARAIGLEYDLDINPVVEIEPLLYKFAKRLEFGQATRQVANDAAKILARMDRDWIVSGRQPPALCGAALILAARMNNFRRSIREVVYVVRAGDATIHKRLEEFRRTKAGRLTVTQFREYGQRLRDQAEPPAVYFARERDEKKKRKRQEAESPGSASSFRQATAPLTPSPSQQLRRDSDGFAIPDTPSPHPRKRGRPRKTPPTSTASPPSTVERSNDGPEATQDAEETTKKRRRKPQPVPEPIVVTDEDLMLEDELEQEIARFVERIDDNSVMEQVKTHTETVIAAEREARIRAGTYRTISDEPELAENEFDDDPEVANCLLTAEEIVVKERIWVTHNHDWLRQQQERILDQELEAAKGKKQRKQQKRIEAKERTAHQTPASSAADASQRMLEKSGKRAFSRHINYEKLTKIYGTGNSVLSSARASEPGAQSSDMPSPGSRMTFSTTTPRRPIGRGQKRVEEKTPEKSPEPSEGDDEADEEEEEEDEDAGAGAEDGEGFRDDYEDDEILEDDEVDYDELGMQGDVYEEDEDDYQD
jgi:transcription factor IIIB subunit 2